MGLVILCFLLLGRFIWRWVLDDKTQDTSLSTQRLNDVALLVIKVQVVTHAIILAQSSSPPMPPIISINRVCLQSRLPMNTSHSSEVMCPSIVLGVSVGRRLLSCFTISSLYRLFATIESSGVVAHGPAIPFATPCLLRPVCVPEEITEGTCSRCQFPERSL